MKTIVFTVLLLIAYTQTVPTPNCAIADLVNSACLLCLPNFQLANGQCNQCITKYTLINGACVLAPPTPPPSTAATAPLSGTQIPPSLNSIIADAKLMAALQAYFQQQSISAANPLKNNPCASV